MQSVVTDIINTALAPKVTDMIGIVARTDIPKRNTQVMNAKIKVTKCRSLMI